MANPPPSHYPDIGDVGEDLVAQWLQSTGWSILHRRFMCRWGEIDIIAQSNDSPAQNSTLAFIEVKTRSPGNWDMGGRSAITTKKQTKLWRTAEIFLAQHPDKADYPCRFDVAIVYCQKISENFYETISNPQVLATSVVAGYQFQLQEYIPAAFDSVNNA
ncbi:YraN family protein [Tolypothrix sp. PCC 7910]|uniref:YraN family protein n=1 Tax=Tolypothrix sp. PCC 7910 TaxID=2099387 RepID=UPI00142793E0|nr:YraN family protein [Tolypothrix sp. PCC 7910]QIR37759.1 YraN family protein [Tolypothrix sp. PCC 7910]